MNDKEHYERQGRELADLRAQLANLTKHAAEAKANGAEREAAPPKLRVVKKEPDRPVSPEPSRIQLIPFDAIVLDDEPEYLVEELIPAGGITILWGPPKSHKSFWMYDVAMRVALGWEYRGRLVQQTTVVYCAFERQKGVKKRCAAFRKVFLADDAAPVPFYLEPIRLNLIKDAPGLAEAITAQIGDTLPGLIVLDTLNRSLVGREPRRRYVSLSCRR